LRELHPRAGSRPWRAVHRQVGDRFVVAAVGPEAQQDPLGFRRACSAAERRLAVLNEWRPCHDYPGLPPPPNFTSGTWLPEYRAEHGRTQFTNQVAIQVIRYRAEHGLTPTAFGRLVGIRQPHVARLESGDHEPSVSTLARLSAALGVDFSLAITPEGCDVTSAQRVGGRPIRSPEIHSRIALANAPQSFDRAIDRFPV